MICERKFIRLLRENKIVVSFGLGDAFFHSVDWYNGFFSSDMKAHKLQNGFIFFWHHALQAESLCQNECFLPKIYTELQCFSSRGFQTPNHLFGCVELEIDNPTQSSTQEQNF
jgi:hypothetical protein